MTTESPQPLTPYLSARSSTRIVGIDVIRILAILAVIFLHTKPFMSAHDYAGTPYGVLRDLIVQFSRFAVPFFFLAAGYFLSRRLTTSPESASLAWPYIRRISGLYLIWSAVYLLFPPDWMRLLVEGNLKPFYWHLANSYILLTNNPIVFIFKSTSVHLWFLPALIFAVSMLALAIRTRTSQFFLPLAGGLYGLGLLADAYSKTSLGLSVNPHLVLGLCYAPLFVGLGWRLATRAMPRRSTAILFIACGFALQLAEAHWLSRRYGLPLVSSSYLIGTVPFGLGFMLLGLTLPAFGGDRVLASIGNMTLGIYLVHLWVKPLLLPLDQVFNGVMWELGFPLLIFTVSLLLTTWLSRSRFRSTVV
jgi:surface polysaccharide O-acyltransferase-like enzyme